MIAGRRTNKPGSREREKSKKNADHRRSYEHARRACAGADGREDKRQSAASSVGGLAYGRKVRVF